MPKFLIVAFVVLLAFSLNVPMGYWRSIVRKFSYQWFLSVHLAVPLIYFLRVRSGLTYWYIPEMVLAALSGQITGGKIKNYWYKRNSQKVEPLPEPEC